jgi:hypothetical protein
MQYWIQPDTDTASINSLQREIGQITGTQINYANSPEGFMFYINEIQNNNWTWNIKSSNSKYFVSIFYNEFDESYAESHNLTIALLTCYLDVLFALEQN